MIISGSSWSVAPLTSWPDSRLRAGWGGAGRFGAGQWRYAPRARQPLGARGALFDPAEAGCHGDRRVVPRVTAVPRD